jgi:hypothetical protein
MAQLAQPEIIAETIAQIYPGTEIVVGSGKSSQRHTVTKVEYQEIPGEPLPALHIRVQSSEEPRTLYLCKDHRVEINVHDSRLRDSVRLVSLNNQFIKWAWQIFDRPVFYAFMNFYCSLEWDLNAFLKNRWEQFAIFATRDKRQFLIERLEEAFTEAAQHSPRCPDRTHCFDGEHLCDPSAHLMVLLDLAMNTHNFLVPTKKRYLGGVSVINGTPQYVHITPGGSFITGQYGQGTCRHPLTRILFWTILLKHRPEFQQLYTRQYQQILLDDLARYRFGTGETLPDLITNFNTNLSLATGAATTRLCIYPIRGWGDQPVVKAKTYEFEQHYKLHLLILSLLRTGWKGRTKIYYCGDKITFTLEICQELLGLPTPEATLAYIKKLTPSTKYDTDSSD